MIGPSHKLDRRHSKAVFLPALQHFTAFSFAGDDCNYRSYPVHSPFHDSNASSGLSSSSDTPDTPETASDDRCGLFSPLSAGFDSGNPPIREALTRPLEGDSVLVLDRPDKPADSPLLPASHTRAEDSDSDLCGPPIDSCTSSPFKLDLGSLSSQQPVTPKRPSASFLSRRDTLPRLSICPILQSLPKSCTCSPLEDYRLPDSKRLGDPFVLGAPKTATACMPRILFPHRRQADAEIRKRKSSYLGHTSLYNRSQSFSRPSSLSWSRCLSKATSKSSISADLGEQLALCLAMRPISSSIDALRTVRSERL
jgi:hypothetical protein